MASIFISYSRRDTRAVDLLAERLQAGGHKVWIDREGIDGGAQWRERIVSAIREADVFLLVLTASSVQSDNVRRELDIAQDCPARLLPVQYGPATIPDGWSYQLAGVQVIDMGTDREAGFARLFAALGQAAPAPQRPARPAPPATESVDLSDLGGGGLLGGLMKGLFGGKKR